MDLMSLMSVWMGLEINNFNSKRTRFLNLKKRFGKKRLLETKRWTEICSENAHSPLSSLILFSSHTNTSNSFIHKAQSRWAEAQIPQDE